MNARSASAGWQSGAASRHAGAGGRIARAFAARVIVQWSAAFVCCLALVSVFSRAAPTQDPTFPPAFLASTMALAFGSLALEQARRAVKLERQAAFQGALSRANLAAALFLGLQCYALWSMFPAERSGSDSSLGVTAFVLALATLHGLHCLVAGLFVCFVSARAAAERYDHEYYWGVSVCCGFWHVLGVVWMAILAVFAIAWPGSI